MSKNKLGQYINFNAIKLFLEYLSNYNSIKPDLIYKNFLDIDPKELKDKYKVKYVIFDKDNTLTIPYENTFPNDLYMNKIKQFQNIFEKHNIAIISNTCGSSDDINHSEAQIVEKNLDLYVIRHKLKKPQVYNEIKQNFKTEKDNEICIIGDRLLVDIIMGKKYNFFTVLVSPIDTSRENIMVKLIRKIENKII